MDEEKVYTGRVLGSIRKLRGFTMAEVAKHIGVDKATIHGYEAGTYFPRKEKAKKLFEKLKVDQRIFEDCIEKSISRVGVSKTSVTIDKNGNANKNIITHGIESDREDASEKANEIISKSIEALKESFREKAENSEVKVLAELPPGRSVPVISEAAAAECNPGLMPLIDCVNQNSEENSYFPNAREGDFAIRVSGNSMLPWYPTGTLLLVRPYQDIYNGKRVIAVLDDGEIVFKIFAKKNDKICLFSINGDGRDFVFPSSGKGLRFLCRVLQSIRNEDDLDEAMAKHGIHHSWEEKLKNA